MFQKLLDAKKVMQNEMRGVSIVSALRSVAKSDAEVRCSAKERINVFQIEVFHGGSR